MTSLFISSLAFGKYSTHIKLIANNPPLSYNSMIPLSYYTITRYGLQHHNSHNNSKINYHSSENTIKRS